MINARFSEKEINPNPHINYITALPVDDAAQEEDARQLLRALAAQVRPVMKSHGFVVNRFEEYRCNKVFLGRNWNHGQLVEIVLRGPTGAYYPISYLMGTLCHELAHIKYMNHGPAFQDLWDQLRREVGELQSKGYYGDGYWSSGTRLADSATVGGPREEAGALPEYMCGGAQSRQQPAPSRRRKDPSGRSGPQRPRKRKAGSRVTAAGTFRGDGHALNEDLSGDEKKKGTGFRKKAGSKKAREERALAAEKRLQALLGKSGPSDSGSRVKDESSEDESEDEENDKDRRQAMLDTVPQSDLDYLRTSRNTFIDDFFFPASQKSNEAGPSRLQQSKEDVEDPGCDEQAVPIVGGSAAGSDSTSPKRKKRLYQQTLDGTLDVDNSTNPRHPNKKAKVSYGSFVSEEVAHRKKEAIGMTGEGRTLGGSSRDRSSIGDPHRNERGGGSRGRGSTTNNDHAHGPEPDILDLTDKEPPFGNGRSMGGHDGAMWTCGVCTLDNKSQHLACDACGTPKGQTSLMETG